MTTDNRSATELLRDLEEKALGRIQSLEDTLKTERENREELERKVNHQRLGVDPTRAPSDPAESWFDVKSRQPIRVYRAGERMSETKADEPSLGKVLRAVCIGGRGGDERELAEVKALAGDTDPSGGYVLNPGYSRRWIDALRAEMVLARAGVVTVPMETRSLPLARLVTDPTSYWHAENAALTDGDPVFGAATLNSKTVVCKVPLSLELSQDSANIEDILSRTITASLASAIDSAGLVGKSTDSAVAPLGIFNTTGVSTLSSVGSLTNWDFVVDALAELMGDDVPVDDVAMISAPSVWKKLEKLKTGISSDQTSLVQPASVQAVRKYWTTTVPVTSGTTSKAIFGRWSDYVMGMRSDISLRVLTQSSMASTLSLVVLAYARCDFVAVRPQSFCIAPGITV